MIAFRCFVSGIWLAQLWVLTVTSPSESSLASTTDGALSFEIQNKYTRRDGQPGQDYPWLSDLVVLAEPYHESTLVVIGAAEPEDSYYYEWQVAKNTHNGSQVAVRFTELGRHSLTLRERDATTSTVLREVHAKVWVKFVRREVRTLFPEDLERYMDALETVYRVKEAEGRDLYGKGYRDLGFFMRVHQTMAGVRTCDHFHDGLGFLNHHTALGLMMDRVIHMVDREAPATPYWDYTIDAIEPDLDKDMNKFFHSVIFDDDLFGGFPSETGNNPDRHQIVKGRFANISLSADYWGAQYAPIKNAYGLLRSPWNVNPAPFLTRSRRAFGHLATYVPACSSHYRMMNVDTKLSMFGSAIQGRPHGPIHSDIGGAWGKNYTALLGDHMEERALRHFAIQTFFYVKNMWRDGYMECPDNCIDPVSKHAGDTTDPAEPCVCTCPGLDSWIANNKTHVVLGHIGIAKDVQKSPSGEDIGALMLKVLCNTDGQGALIGDNSASSAAADPTFWILHPTTERLLQWRRLKGMEFSWPEKNYDRIPGVCWGHGANDTTIWKNLFDDIDDHYYTNAELFYALDPHHGNKMDYIYDNFQWPHCATHFNFPVRLIEEVP